MTEHPASEDASLVMVTLPAAELVAAALRLDELSQEVRMLEFKLALCVAERDALATSANLRTEAQRRAYIKYKARRGM